MGVASYADDLRHAILMTRDTLFPCAEPGHCPRYKAKPHVRAMINFMALTAFKIIPDSFQKSLPPQRGSLSVPRTEKRGLALVS